MSTSSNKVPSPDHDRDAPDIRPDPPPPGAPIDADDALAGAAPADAAGSPPAVLLTVGIGASAGGLTALEAFLKNTPPNTGMAFVVIMHLMRDTKSNLSNLLQGYTRMPVAQITDGMEIAPDHVYVIPPGFELGLINGRLQLLTLTSARRAMAIDSFFRHLADDRGPRAACVVLSGTGTDGTLGLKAISERGGLVVVQSPESADYSGMPGSAIDTGLADLVLAPAEMSEALLKYAQKADFGVGGTQLKKETRETLDKIFLLLRAETGLDLTYYRASTLYRRISKRMAVHQLSEMSDYVDYLRRSPKELGELYRDILIGVTHFFREPQAFEAIKTRVLPMLFEKEPQDRPLRIWVPGCSTGEEAYSLAMLIHDYKQQISSTRPVDIFATDINLAGVETARLGEFPRSITADVPEPYLERYFIEREHTFQIKPQIREMIVFAQQNLLRDPPFSKLDFISCRNLMIYLKPTTQRQVLTLFQYALAPGGVLFLGSSENIGDMADHFSVIDRQWRLFKRTGSRIIVTPDVGFFAPVNYGPTGEPNRPGLAAPAKKQQQHLLEQSLLAHYEPVGIMVDEAYNILYTYGAVDRYLKIAPGEARLNIMDMLRSGLDLRLPAIIRYTLTKDESSTLRLIRVKVNGDEELVDVTVKSVGSSPDRPLALIIIEPGISPKPDKATTELAEPPAAQSGAQATEHIRSLERDLATTNNRLQDVMERLRSATQEHRSFSEELQSANEELQSTNEELTTSQEELRSVNEELVTSNAEINQKNQKLRQANNDLHNLLAAVDIATVFLDTERKIKRFTPAATKIINLIESDRGRPFKHVVTNFKDEALYEDLSYVLDTLNTVEREIQTESDQWFNMRIMPYRTTENIIEGLVLTFAEITAQKEVEADLRWLNEALSRARDYAHAIIDTLHESVLILDESLHVVLANSSFYQKFELAPETVEQRPIYELADHQWDIPQLRELLEEIIPQDQVIERYDIEYEFPHLGRRTMRLNARRLNRPQDEANQILLAIQEINGRDESGEGNAGG